MCCRVNRSLGKVELFLLVFKAGLHPLHERLIGLRELVIMDRLEGFVALTVRGELFSGLLRRWRHHRHVGLSLVKRLSRRCRREVPVPCCVLLEAF